MVAFLLLILLSCGIINVSTPSTHLSPLHIIFIKLVLIILGTAATIALLILTMIDILTVSSSRRSLSVCGYD